MFKEIIKYIIEKIKTNESGWLTNKGEFLELTGDTHSWEIFANPSAYIKRGIPIRKFNEDGTKLVDYCLKNGWIAVRFWGNYCSIIVWDYNSKVKNNLLNWIVQLPFDFRIQFMEARSNYSEHTTVGQLIQN